MKTTRPFEGERWLTGTAVMFLASMLTLMRALLAVKLFFLVLFLFTVAWNVYRHKMRIPMHARLGWFYLWIGLVGIAWTFIGVLHPTNSLQANLGMFRLYVLWSGAFFVLYTLLKAGPSLRIFHWAMVLAGILIPLLNLFALYDQIAGLGLLSEAVREELSSEVGIQEGFLRYNAVNLIGMFLIAPYLVSLQFRSKTSKWVKLALFLSLAFTVLSGRRALWVVVTMTPCLILLLSWLTGNSVRGKRLLFAWTGLALIGLSTVLLLPESRFEDSGSLNHLKQAFLDDARIEQRPYLIEGFLKSPVFGSGFGAHVSYTRSDETPWAYELTYYQMLFNLGIVGSGLLLALFAAYFRLDIKLLRQFNDGSAIPFALLIAFCSLLIGAYSNPYLGGFDSLFFVGLLPFLSTFQHGFAAASRDANT